MKLNLGAGGHLVPGYMSVDIGGKVDQRLNLAEMPWPWADRSATEILASHVLEHFDRATGRVFLAECRRVLMPGGVLHLAVPDMDLFVDGHLTGQWNGLSGYKWKDLNFFMGGDHTETNLLQRHRYMYCFDSLAHVLEGLGFAWARRRGPCELDNPDYAALSLYVDALK